MGLIPAGNIDCGRRKPGAPRKRLNHLYIPEIMTLSMLNTLPIVAEEKEKNGET
jgi:hypothetical protein